MKVDCIISGKGTFGSSYESLIEKERRQMPNDWSHFTATRIEQEYDEKWREFCLLSRTSLPETSPLKTLEHEEINFPNSKVGTEMDVTPIDEVFYYFLNQRITILMLYQTKEDS